MAKKSFMEEEYKLKRRPFEERVATELLLKSWVDREKQVGECNDLVEKAISSKSNFLSFIVGDYGMGKTMSLLKAVEDSSEHKEIFSVYLNFLGEQKPRNPGIDFIQKIFKSIDFEKLSINKENQFFTGIPSEIKSVYEKILYGEKEIKKLALYFLRGEVRPSQSQLKKLGIIRKIDDIEVAKEYLTGFLCLLKSSGFSTLLLAIDEFEYLFSLVSRANQSIYLALLRGLYDLAVPKSKEIITANILFFIAVSNDGWTHMQDLEKGPDGPINPLLRRVYSKLRLEAFSRENTEELIEKRLSLNRITGKLAAEPLIPFTRDFVDYLYKLTSGRPSDIIVRCDHVLDAGEGARVRRLTGDFAEQLFEKRGFTY